MIYLHLKPIKGYGSQILFPPESPVRSLRVIAGTPGCYEDISPSLSEAYFNLSIRTLFVSYLFTMSVLIKMYREIFDVPDTTSDKVAIAHLVLFNLLLFLLGYLISHWLIPARD